MGAKGSATRARRPAVAISLALALSLLVFAAGAGGRGAIPPPTDADPRLLAADAALGVSLGKVQDTRGRRPVSLKKLFRKVGPRAFRRTHSAIAQGLEMVDTLVAERARAASDPARAGGGNCDPPPGGPSQSFNGNGFDATVDFSKGQAQIGVEVGKGGVRIETDINLCDTKGAFKAADCPTADGVVEASDHSQFFVTVRVFEGGTLAYSQRARFQDEMKLKAQVGDDAKLDYFDIEHVYRTTISVGGSRQRYGPVTMKLAYTGKTRVDMPSGNYEPGSTDVDVDLRMTGVEESEQRAAEAEQERKLRGDADKSFADAIEKAIKNLRSKEEGWNEVNRCASVKFEPASGSITLKQGDSGQLQARIESNQGGSPPKASWTMSEPANASFSPDTAEGNPSSFGYTASRVGVPAEVKATFKAVSRAGVARETWIQRSEPGPPPGFAGPINGTAAYDSGELGAGNHLDAEWFGNLVVTFSPPSFPGEPPTYRLTGGTVQYSYTGRVGGCNVVGGAPINLAAQPDLNGSAVLTFFHTSPRTYQLLVPMPALVQIVGMKTNCDDPNDNGDDFPWSPATGIPWLVYAPNPGGPVADDWSISGTGSGNQGGGTPDQTWFWNQSPTS